MERTTAPPSAGHARDRRRRRRRRAPGRAPTRRRRSRPIAVAVGPERLDRVRERHAPAGAAPRSIEHIVKRVLPRLRGQSRKQILLKGLARSRSSTSEDVVNVVRDVLDLHASHADPTVAVIWRQSNCIGAQWGRRSRPAAQQPATTAPLTRPVPLLTRYGDLAPGPLDLEREAPPQEPSPAALRPVALFWHGLDCSSRLAVAPPRRSGRRLTCSARGGGRPVGPE